MQATGEGRVMIALMALLLAAPAISDEAYMQRLLSGGPMLEAGELAAAVAAADAQPLGSAANPVRVLMPAGQLAYLRRLRCGDGQIPAFRRVGSQGQGPFASIVDLYTVDCGAATPGKVEIRMDMYHRGHVETRAVPGFTLAPE